MLTSTSAKSPTAEAARIAAVAEHWGKLIDAARAGDSQAAAFLPTFEAFAREQLGAVRRT